jgi:hypothetical protein
VTLTSVLVLADAYKENPLAVPTIVFPIVAISVFALLGFVAWSYRDVANRHAGRSSRGGDHHGPTV